MLAALWDLILSFSHSLSLSLVVTASYISSGAKFLQMALQGHKLSSNPFPFIHRSIVFCLIDCEPAGVHPARVRQTPGFTNESGGEKDPATN